MRPFYEAKAFLFGAFVFTSPFFKRFFVCRIVMAAYTASSRVLSSPYIYYRIHAEPEREYYPISCRLIVTHSVSSLLCAHPPLNPSNTNDLNY